MVTGGANMSDSIQVVRKVFASGSPALSAFDYLLAHAGAAAFTLVPRTSGTVLAVEFQWADQRRNPFAAQAHAHHTNFYLRKPVLTAHPHLFDAATKIYGEVKSNSLDEYRLHLRSPNEVDALLQFLREQGAWPSHRHDRRFLAATFAPLTGEHFLRAAQRLASGFVDHPFDPSNKYDLLFDGHRLAPKAVFGLAASEALGFPVRPENFSGGDDTLSFRLLRDHGYRIVGKDERGSLDPALVSEDDRTWAEGRPRMVTHLRRERGTGLAAAKKDQFRAQHGRLFCERCKMDPIKVFGAEFGEACIEIHHRDTRLSDMLADHETKLDDLACLCANCHRVTHRELAAERSG